MSSGFFSYFSKEPIVCEFARGRVNLIGEHTDYNGGFVLPILIAPKTQVWMAPRSDNRVEAVSVNIPGKIVYILGEEAKQGNWTDYLQGVTKTAHAHGFTVSGFDVLVESQVPLGCGLSSSAALEVALFRALRKIFSWKLDDVLIAKMGQEVENQFVGARVGIMDQMVCSRGEWGSALFLDTKNLQSDHVPLPEEFSLAIINSGVSHSLATGEYNIRRAQCEEVCARLGIASLRDLSSEDFPVLEKVTEVLARRARHVVTENARVLKAVKALRAGDLESLGRLFTQSHVSLRDDYQVSIPQIDLLVNLACQDSRVFGARMTGGGFGGAVIVLTRAGVAQSVAEDIVAKNHDGSGRERAMIMISEGKRGEMKL